MHFPRLRFLLSVALLSGLAADAIAEDYFLHEFHRQELTSEYTARAFHLAT